jgi:hypothetical protein
LAHKPLDILEPGYVGLKRPRLHTERPNLAGRLFQRFGRTPAECDMGAMARQRKRNCLANAPAPAGDECNAVLGLSQSLH